MLNFVLSMSVTLLPKVLNIWRSFLHFKNKFKHAIILTGLHFSDQSFIRHHITVSELVPPRYLQFKNTYYDSAKKFY